MDDASDKTRTTDEPEIAAEVEVRMVWRDAPAACAKCKRDLGPPGPVAKHGDEMLCHRCLYPLLGTVYPCRVIYEKDLAAVPDAAILWLNEPGKCCQCSVDLRTPGPVGLIPKGPVCTVCLDFEEPTLSWILRLAYAVREAQGYWPGATRHATKPPPGWSRGDERPDWSHAKKTGRWPSVIRQWPYPHG